MQVEPIYRFIVQQLLLDIKWLTLLGRIACCMRASLKHGVSSLAQSLPKYGFELKTESVINLINFKRYAIK